MMLADDNELRSILLRGYESKGLDYKGPTAWDESDKKASCELVKDILGMANSGGGFIVIGVSEVGGVLDSVGLSAEQIRTYDTTRLNRFVQNYADPPVNAFLKKFEHEGKRFVIIEVPPFVDTPHICQKDFPGVLVAPALYVRTDNNETAPLRSSADFRQIVERAVRNRRDSLLTAMRSILTSGPLSPPQAVLSEEQFLRQRVEAEARFESLNPLKAKGYTEYHVVCFFPETFNAERFEIEQLRSAAQQASVDFTGWPFLFMHPNRPDTTWAMQDGIESLIATKDWEGDDMLDFWRFQQSGFFYKQDLMRDEPWARRLGLSEPATDFTGIAMYAGEVIFCLSRLYDGLLEENEEVILFFRLLGTQDRQLTSLSGHMPLFGGYTCRMPEIQFQCKRSLADWRAGMLDHAVDLTNEIYQRFNWVHPNLATARNTIDNMLKRRL